MCIVAQRSKIRSHLTKHRQGDVRCHFIQFYFRQILSFAIHINYIPFDILHIGGKLNVSNAKIAITVSVLSKFPKNTSVF